jgi:RNA polymerase sigma-70 factor (ECF subfamily)
MPLVARHKDAPTVNALRARDERAFIALVEEHGAAMLRTARIHVRSEKVAEEVVQETWLAVLAGIDRFEGRSSLRTWVFAILVNLARTAGEREARSRPLSSFDDGLAMVEERVAPRGDGEPEVRALAAFDRARIEAAIASLPERQRILLTLRDVCGFDAEEACELLALTPVNQRVLLHRARRRVCGLLARQAA